MPFLSLLLIKDIVILNEDSDTQAHRPTYKKPMGFI